MNPTEIKCVPCGGVQTVYSCRRGTSLAVGIPTECQSKHECRRVAYAVLDAAKERAIDHLTQWANKVDPLSDIARAADFIANQPHASPVELMGKRVIPYPELHPYQRQFIDDCENAGIHNVVLCKGRMPGIDSTLSVLRERSLDLILGNIYANILMGRRLSHWNAQEWKSNRVFIDVSILPKRDVQITSELIYKLQNEEDDNA